MKIAVSSTGRTLDASVDPRFGRCALFIIVDTDTMASTVVDNGSDSLSGGAGIQTARLLIEQGVAAVLTGNCGPNAYRTLNAAGVQVVVGCAGTVADVVAQYQSGSLRPTSGANVDSHAGLGRG
jgi:predicted Fe-Mo cluster-binding NifX family protein